MHRPRQLARTRRAFVQEGQHSRTFDVARVQLLDSKSRVLDELHDRSIQVAAAGDASPQRRESVLPEHDACIW